MKRVRYILEFPPETSGKPLTYHLVKDYDLKVNILRGVITAGKEGRLLIELEAEEENIDKGIRFLEEQGVTLKPLSQQIFVDLDRCVHCGACTAVCFSGALSLDRETWKLSFDPEKCVACELCVSACPLQLINVAFNSRV
ncbi:MAG TPA: hypothetical protein DEA47_04535 [Peptococcaceae bacterium]|nr:MAG: 4Fe-4S ferredoxin, iron-sulfur binding domain protein [Clostridia bacterium 41_269]HBT20613.1 hypothetical protein [Peptococcaceae bacterium]